LAAWPPRVGLQQQACHCCRAAHRGRVCFPCQAIRNAALAITDPTVASRSFSLQERSKNDYEDAVDVVAAVTIPETLDAVPDGACFIVKIDIEGGCLSIFCTKHRHEML
jgi:hypothetical protein